MSERTVNLPTLFLGRLRPPQRLISIKSILFRQLQTKSGESGFFLALFNVLKSFTVKSKLIISLFQTVILSHSIEWPLELLCAEKS